MGKNYRPLMILVSPKNVESDLVRRYKYPIDQEINATSIVKFVNDFYDDKLEPEIKYEMNPIPYSNYTKCLTSHDYLEFFNSSYERVQLPKVIYFHNTLCQKCKIFMWQRRRDS